MKAAVVHSFSRAPSYADFDEPKAKAGEVLVKPRAAALSQLVKAIANGKHYSSEAKFPFIPGVDGVGLLPDGSRVYFAFPTKPFGTMAELVAVNKAYCVAIPDEVDSTLAAGIANPGMSSWAALTQRAKFKKGETVLINGATGVSGRLAIQIARHLGAKKILATGRNADSIKGLATLGADVLIPLDEPPEQLAKTFQRHLAAHGVDIILDYLWGTSAECLIKAISGHGSSEVEPRRRFVQIGGITSPTITLPAGALRSSGLELLGSGLGSVSNATLVACIGELLQAVVPAKLQVAVEAVPLSRCEAVWASESAERIVFTL